MNDHRRDGIDGGNARQRKLDLRDQVGVTLEHIDTGTQDILHIKPRDEATHQPEDIGHIRSGLVTAFQADLKGEPEAEDVNGWLGEKPEGAEHRASGCFLQIEQAEAQDLLAPESVPTIPISRNGQPDEPLFYHCLAGIAASLRDSSIEKPHRHHIVARSPLVSGLSQKIACPDEISPIRKRAALLTTPFYSADLITQSNELSANAEFHLPISRSCCRRETCPIEQRFPSGYRWSA